MASSKAKKEAPRARERRAAAREAQGITQKGPLGSFVSVERVRQALAEVVEDQFQLVLEEVRSKGSGTNRTLEVVIDYPEDRTDSLDLDTLAEVSQALSSTLDSLDDGEVPYQLEVSSRGVSSPLTERRHWRRSIDRLLQITDSSGQTYLARLDFVTEEGPVVRPKKETKKGQAASYKEPKTLPWQTISSAKVEIEFNR